MVKITRAWASIDEPIRVTAELEDGSHTELFAFYSDELRFDEEELIGLTRRGGPEPAPPPRRRLPPVLTRRP